MSLIDKNKKNGTAITAVVLSIVGTILAVVVSALETARPGKLQVCHALSPAEPYAQGTDVEER